MALSSTHSSTGRSTHRLFPAALSSCLRAVLTSSGLDQLHLSRCARLLYPCIQQCGSTQDTFLLAPVDLLYLVDKTYSLQCSGVSGTITRCISPVLAIRLYLDDALYLYVFFTIQYTLYYTALHSTVQCTLHYTALYPPRTWITRHCILSP